MIEGIEPKPEKSDCSAREHKFGILKDEWWWLNPTKTRLYADNPVAWQWELLRRTRAYETTFEERNAYVAGTNPISRVLVGPLRDDPSRRWHSLFLADCAPNRDWSSLRERSRNAVEFNAPLYPRADVLANFTSELVIEGVIVRRQENGAEKLESAHEDGYVFPPGLPDPRTTTNAAILGKHPATQILAAGAGSGAYVVVIFDVRLGRSVAQQLSIEKNRTRLKICLQDLRTRLKSDPNWPLVHIRKSNALVLPSVQLYYAQAWIPSDCETVPEEIEARFTSLADSRESRNWLPECSGLWKSDSFEKEQYTEFPARLKAKPARAIYNDASFRVGFCALDCKRIEHRFSKKGLLLSFLRGQAGFENIDSPARLADGLKRVSRLISEIDRFYLPGK